MIPQFIDLGLRNFLDVQEIQKDLLWKRKNNLCDDTVLISQFYPVITLGRGAKESDILAGKEMLVRKNIAVCQTNRGGGVTLHLPGQLVIYPVLDLRNLKKDIGFYIKFLEEWIIKLLEIYGIRARTNGINSGVWVEDRKICFIGIGISRWVSFHGLSLNISPDLECFSSINPCGIKNLKVTSLKEELRFIPQGEEIKKNLRVSLRDILEEKGFLYAVNQASAVAG